MSTRSSITHRGLSFGSALAMAISYGDNHSIPWAILHGLLGWLYVLWAAILH